MLTDRNKNLKISQKKYSFKKLKKKDNYVLYLTIHFFLVNYFLVII